MKMPITAWQVIRPYWVSNEKWLARGLLLLVILFDMATIYAAVKISYWQKDFFDALAAYDLSAIKPLMITLLILMAISVSTGVFSIYFKQLLEIRWRTWVTEVFIQKWLKDNKFYHIEQKSATDNPDQRIAEDLALMADKTLSLFTGFIRNFVNMISYGVIIWGISGSMVVHVFGGDYIVPGLLLWIGIAYALLGSLIMEKIGRPMVKLDYKQQRFEADFRYLLMRIRENSEQIALYKGQKIEKQRLRHSFSAVRQNWRGIMTYTKRIAFVEALYIDIGGYLPYFLIVPQYFAKKISIGEVMQTSIAFSRLRQALSWFIFNYKELAEVRAVLQRLCEFEGAIQQPVHKDIKIEYHHNQGLQTQALSLSRPTGELLSAIPNTQIQQGDRWLIQGRSGIGKSTFLRALAGLWVYGDGQIFLPQGSTLFFLPQKSYLPYGSLKAALCYPKSEHDFTDEACAQILENVHLPEQILNLHHIEYWEKRLSPGEQQRLAFARILLHKPDYLFLDEATSALDINNEKNLYQLLVDVLPNTTVISIAHHQSLEDFHTHILKFDQIKTVNS